MDGTGSDNPGDDDMDIRNQPWVKARAEGGSSPQPNGSDVMKRELSETTAAPASDAEADAPDAPASKPAKGKGKGKGAAKAKAKAPAKGSAKKAASKPAKGKAAPKAKPAKATKAASKPKGEKTPLDKFGFREGSIKSKAAAMYAEGKGATLAEVKAKLGSVQLNLLKELEDKGFTVDKKREAPEGGRPVTRYKLKGKASQ